MLPRLVRRGGQKDVETFQFGLNGRIVPCFSLRLFQQRRQFCLMLRPLPFIAFECQVKLAHWLLRTAIGDSTEILD